MKEALVRSQERSKYLSEVILSKLPWFGGSYEFRMPSSVEDRLYGVDGYLIFNNAFKIGFRDRTYIEKNSVYYNDLVFRIRRIPGTSSPHPRYSEYYRIQAGVSQVDYYFYSWSEASLVQNYPKKWVLIDMSRAKKGGLFDKSMYLYVHRWNQRDDTGFVAIPIEDFRAVGSVLYSQGFDFSKTIGESVNEYLCRTHSALVRI